MKTIAEKCDSMPLTYVNNFIITKSPLLCNFVLTLTIFYRVSAPEPESVYVQCAYMKKQQGHLIVGMKKYSDGLILYQEC